jgi:hypothetical protein
LNTCILHHDYINHWFHSWGKRDNNGQKGENFECLDLENHTAPYYIFTEPLPYTSALSTPFCCSCTPLKNHYLLKDNQPLTEALSVHLISDGHSTHQTLEMLTQTRKNTKMCANWNTPNQMGTVDFYMNENAAASHGGNATSIPL